MRSVMCKHFEQSITKSPSSWFIGHHSPLWACQRAPLAFADTKLPGPVYVCVLCVLSAEPVCFSIKKTCVDSKVVTLLYNTESESARRREAVGRGCRLNEILKKTRRPSLRLVGV